MTVYVILFCYVFSASEYGLYTHKEKARFQCALLDALVSDVKFVGFDRTKHTVSCDSYPGYEVSSTAHFEPSLLDTGRLEMCSQLRYYGSFFATF